MINDKLVNLYKSHLSDIAKFYADLDAKGIKDYAGPHLPYCWEEEYRQSPFKLVVVGQETNGWYRDYMTSEGEISKAIGVYRDFELGAGYNSTLLRYANNFNQALNGRGRLNYVWLNVNKFGKDSGVGKPDQAVLDDEVRYFNVLRPLKNSR